MSLLHGPGVYADPTARTERWGGRKAQAFVRLVLDTYGYTCMRCGLPITVLDPEHPDYPRKGPSADHVIPRADGGAV